MLLRAIERPLVTIYIRTKGYWAPSWSCKEFTLNYPHFVCRVPIDSVLGFAKRTYNK